MLILLPPSEGKTAPEKGPPVDLEALAYADELTESRRKLLGALAALAELPLERAVSMLAVSKGQAGEVAVDAELGSAPAAPGRRGLHRRPLRPPAAAGAAASAPRAEC